MCQKKNYKKSMDQIYADEYKKILVEVINDPKLELVGKCLQQFKAERNLKIDQ